MTVWVTRAGRFGERESLALEQNQVVIGWDEVPDLNQISSRSDLQQVCRNTYPDVKQNTIYNWVGQLWTFKERIQTGDLVVLPLKTQAAIAVGRVTGTYQFRSDNPTGARHTRTVAWLRTDIPRAAFDQDLLYSFGAFMTVCQVQRTHAQERVEAVLAGKSVSIGEGESGEELPDGIVDLEEYAHDQIRGYIGQRFRGHDLARLVDYLLIAEGYHTQRSSAGRDGGVDIIAGRGPMGFESPKICVQVKSSDSPVDVNVLRELQGVIRQFGADQGLLVSWGGFKSSVISEARRLFFEIRLWDGGDLVRTLLSNYERLPAELQAELPLKTIWALVPEE